MRIRPDRHHTFTDDARMPWADDAAARLAVISGSTAAAIKNDSAEPAQDRR